MEGLVSSREGRTAPYRPLCSVYVGLSVCARFYIEFSMKFGEGTVSGTSRSPSREARS